MKFFTSKKEVKITVFSITPFNGKCQNLQNVGQGHRVQFSQLHQSMANIKIYKCLPQIFVLALILQRYNNFKFLNSKKDQGHRLQFLLLHHLMAVVKNLQKSPTHFRASFYHFRDTTILPHIFAHALALSEIYNFEFFTSSK